MRLEEFDYPLPKELIAQVPLNKRDLSRLMVVKRATDEIYTKKFFDILDIIKSGDVLVLNDTKVFPARIFGKKETGGAVELLLVKRLSGNGADGDGSGGNGDGEDAYGKNSYGKNSYGGNVFSALTKSSKPVRVGHELIFDGGLTGEVMALSGNGMAEIKFTANRDIFSILDEIGVMPLPPYIKRGSSEHAESDKVRYQTVYAEKIGAIAAPTAGLHFTDELLRELVARGVKIARVTLHVGLGTFMPVRVDNVTDHKMHEEFFSVSDDCIDKIVAAKKRGGKVIAVGTTSVRALESAFDEDLSVKRREGSTDIFIYPGYSFKVIDSLITNFHLPKSTLLMLIYAFGGADLMKRAYKRAVDSAFRFFSYGDAMYID